MADCSPTAGATRVQFPVTAPVFKQKSKKSHTIIFRYTFWFDQRHQFDDDGNQKAGGGDRPREPGSSNDDQEPQQFSEFLFPLDARSP